MDKYSRWHDNKGSDGWADEALDFLFDHELCDKAMAWALGVKGEYDEDYMQRVFESLPEYKNGRNISQEEIAESYIEFFGLDEQFDREWEEKNGGYEE
jgi:hypothetical protein